MIPYVPYPLRCSILADNDFIWITSNTEFQDIL